MNKVHIAWTSTDAHYAEVDAAQVMTDGEIDHDKVREWVSDHEGSETFTWEPVAGRNIHTVRLLDTPAPDDATPPAEGDR